MLSISCTKTTTCYNPKLRDVSVSSCRRETIRNLISDVAAAAWRHYALSLNPASGATRRWSILSQRWMAAGVSMEIAIVEYCISLFLLTVRCSDNLYSHWIKIWTWQFTYHDASLKCILEFNNSQGVPIKYFGYFSKQRQWRSI